MLLLTVGLAGVLQAIASVPASATSNCTSTTFSDDFTTDTSLSGCWQTGTALISTVASDFGEADNSPVLNFGNYDETEPSNYMDMSGADNTDTFTAIQSANAYAAPFQFAATVNVANVDRGDTWAIYLVNPSRPSEAFSVETDTNSSDAPPFSDPPNSDTYGMWANNGLGTTTSNTALLSPNTPTDATYDIAMSIDTYGYGSVSVNGGPQISVGYIGLGSFDVLLGQRELNTLIPGGQDGGWFSAGLTPNYCSAYNFSDDFANDGSLNASCWQAATAATVGSYTALNDLNSNYVHATYESPSLAFSSGMQMTGLTGTPQWTGIQSAQTYSPPFQLTTSVTGNSLAADDFSIYVTDAKGATAKTFAVEGDFLNQTSSACPGNSVEGLWAADSAPAGWCEGSTPILSSLAAGTTYDITMAVNANGTDSVSVNGGPPVEVNGGQSLGSGPFYVVLAQRESTNQYDGPIGEGLPLEATWGSVSLQPSVATTLAVNPGSVGSVESVPESSVAATSVGSSSSTAGDTASAPLDSIPLDSIYLGSAPLDSIPLDSIPLDSIPLDSIAAPGAGAPPALVAAETALSSTLLSDISIKYSSTCGGAACAGWAAILYGTPFANVPLESVTLADVLNNATANTAFGNVSLADLDLSNTPLGSIPLASVELGPTPLSDISLPGAQGGTTPLQAWCTELASLHSSCADFGMSPTNDNGVTLLSLALAGVPLDSIPLDSIPLDSIPLDSIPLDSIPLDSIPLDSIQLASSPLDSIPLDSIPLDSIPLDSIPLDSIPLDSIGTLVNCLGSVSCTTGTLGEAYAAGVLQPSATIGELVGALPAGDFAGTSLAQLLVGDNSSVAGYPSITLGDVLLATEPPASYPWQSVSLPSLPVARPPEVTFTYSYTFGQPVNFNLQAALPSGFSYVPGSTTESGEGSIPDPIVSGSTLIFGQQDESAPFYPFTGTITFKATPGLDIGPQATTMSDTVVDGSQNAIDSSTAASALNVVDSEDPTIDTPGDSIVLPTGTVSLPGDLNVGYLRSQGDVNDWQVTVSQGDELSLALTNLPATYDLEVFGPNGQSLSPTPPTEAVPGVSDTLPSVTPSSNTEGTPGSEDLQITPPEGYSRLLAISNNPDAQSQYIQTPPLAAGEYMVQISGYNGAFSTQPYLLQANLLGGGTTPTCPGIAYPNTLADPSTGPPATLAIPSGAATVTPAGATNVSGTLNTLFLVDTQRLTAAFGATAETNIMNDIQADATTTGVVGAIVPVDAWASVQSAYSIWNPDPCSVIGGNDVVSAISSVVDSIEAKYPSVQNVVIVGADDQIPFARIADGTTQSNERDYGQSTFEGQDNVEGDALSLGYYFSDDPYAASEPLGVGSATLYSPQLAVGRLVESAGEIEGALTRFSSTGGNLDASASLTTGYSFLTSGAQAVSANLAGNGLTASDLINEDWQAGDLDSALTATNPTPGVDSINAHFDYSRGLPAYGNTTGNDSNLFTTTDIRNSVSTYAGRLLFSMGCHAGLDVDDAEVETSLSAAPVDDWAKAFADAGALWVANTGFGYADTDTIAYSAKLMTGFAANLNGSLTIGEALTEAKQQYEAGNAILSPYDLKALMESTLYGLPMYTLNGSSGTAPSVPSGPPTGTDPVTGMTVAPVSLNLGSGSSALPGQLSLVTTPNGDYYQVNGSTSGSDGTQATEYRPIEPLVSLPVTEAGLVPHGAIVTGLSSTDTPFTPAISMPAVGSSDSTPPTIDDAAFPGTLQRVAGYSTFTSTGTGQGATLDLVAGQFFPNPSSPGSGTERLFNTMSAEVYYDQPGSRYASDYTPATIDFTQAVTTGSDVNFAVQVTAGGAPVTRVLVLYTDAAHPGAWTAVDLSSSDGQNWSGASPSASSGVQYLVEAVDAAGNVAVSNNEGTAFDSTPQPSTSTPAISIALSGNGPTNGYYTGAVTATVTAPSGSTYVVDDSQVPQPVPAGGTVTVTGAGPHEISVTDPSGHTSSQGFAIASAFTSSSGTTTALSSSAGSVPAGGSVTLTATVTAESPSAGTPTGNVEFLDGTNPINGCADEPLSGAVATCNATGLSTGPHQVTAEYLAAGEFASSTANPVDVVVLQAAPFTITVNAGSSAAVAPGTPATLAESGLPLLATGTVTFYTNNGTELCSFSFGTSTSCPTSASLTSQTDSGIYSTFADTDGSYASSKSTNTVSLTVSAATQFSITVNGSSSAAAIAFGSSATLAESGLPSTATGPVSFTSGSTTLCSFVLSSTTTNCSTS
ncbi:MAG: Ig-like domain repeat protein, partial [Acidimicrobiales bacterium]